MPLGSPRFVAALSCSLAMVACSFDWATLDPREAVEGAGGGGASGGASGGGTSGQTGGGGDGSTSATGGSTGVVGGGGSGPDPIATCIDFCVVLFGCQSMGDGGGGGAGGSIPPDRLRQICTQECAAIIDICPPEELPEFLDCMGLVESCDDVEAFYACSSMLACNG